MALTSAERSRRYKLRRKMGLVKPELVYKLTKRNSDRAYHQRIKLEALNAYGGCKCIMCTEIRTAALTLDHINNDGIIHRGIINLYQFLKANNFPPGFQVLCANCNWLKHLTILNAQPRSQNPSSLRSRQHYARIKKMIMARLGGKCIICKADNIEILTIHHKNGDGAAHRKTISKGRSGVHFYDALIRTNDDLTALECRCFSCNDAEDRI